MVRNSLVSSTHPILNLITIVEMKRARSKNLSNKEDHTSRSLKWLLTWMRAAMIHTK